MTKVQEMIGQDLVGFEIVEMTEVYRTGEDGRKSQSLGFFKNANTAEAFIGTHSDTNFHKTAPAFILTNSVVSFVINEQESVKIFNDKDEVVEIKKKVLAKLSPAERKLLGFE